MASYKCAKKSHKTATVEQEVCRIAKEIEGNDDLVTKILLFLPARPLFRFKLVSKRWTSLISNPYFSSLWSPEPSPSALILQVLSRPKDPCCISLKDEAITVIHRGVIDFVKDDPSDCVEILNSCGGLIVCHRLKQIVGRAKWINEYIVCNPTTKQFTTLPKPIMTSFDMSLAFDHSISLHYKVINVSLFHIEIYSSETNLWKQCRAQFPKPFQSPHIYGKGVFFNGAIFWTLMSLRSFYYFDIDDTEVLHSHPMPKMDIEYYFGCVDEHLYLVGSSVSEWPQLDIFELGHDYSSWSLKYRIDLHGVAGVKQMVYSTRDFFSLKFSVFSVVTRKEGNNQEPYLVFYIPGQLILVSFKNNHCSKLRKLPVYASAEMLRSFNGIKRDYHLIENPFWIGNKLSSIGL
ncbi:F-box protein At5g07610-like [Lycium barbarum]|uniref:F-box protein At5g07610-like n=1 Tax=Lycium barbarum TaxID=112863 RepID=UPI00293EF354|nr:F-box protein At5g07610-like [Lycium barbarum]